MITKQTCVQIWNAWNEIERAEKMREDLLKAHNENNEEMPNDIRNAFGDNRGAQLHIPTSFSSSTILSGVSIDLSVSIIDAHIEKQRRRLKELEAVAKLELHAINTSKPTAPATESGSKQ